jgi:Baseplate J-like protein
MSSLPLIDARTGEEIVEQGKALATEYTLDWTPREGDRGLAMLSLFGRLMEIVISRLNRVPEKSFLAFLDTAGVSLLPPKAARAPVRFVAVEGAPDDGVAPAGTQIATAPPSGEAPVTFETEKNLVVHRARLLYLYTLDPADDRYDDHTEVLSANEQNESMMFQPFVGTTLIPHRLYLAQDTLFRINHPTTVILEFTLSAWDAAYESFFRKKLLWKTFGADEEISDITPPASAVSANATAATITVTFDNARVTKIVQKPVAAEKQVHSWIWAETAQKLSSSEAAMQIKSIGVKTEAADIPPEAAFFNAVPLDTTQAFSPFGERPKLNDTLYLACPEAFSKEGSRVRIGLAYRSGAASADCSLQWEFWNGAAWETLGTSTSIGPVVNSGTHLFSDPTAAFGGTILRDSGGVSALNVLALKQDVTVSIANATSAATNRFKLTVSAGGVVLESHDELEVNTAEERINGVSSSVMIRNLVSASRPQNVTSRQVFYDRSVTVEFKCPAISETEINGKKNYWLRVRLAGGDYGKDARLTLSPTADAPYTLDKWKYIAPSFKTPIITFLAISYVHPYPARPAVTVSNGWTYNNFEYASVPSDGKFFPFRAPGGTQPALYVGFDRAFAPRPVSLFVAVEESTFTTPPTVVWEYWSGNGPKNLGVQDGTANLTESGTVEFIGPPDASAGDRFDVPAPRFWIRARLEAGDKQKIALHGAYLNTTWTENCTTIRNELLGSSTETPNAEFTLSRSPVLEGLKIEVREPDRPSEAELDVLRDEEGEDALQPADQGQVSSREYWVRWHRVDDFRFSARTSRHFTIDWSTGRIRFGDGKKGMIPPAGRDNIRAAWYQSGGGAKGTAARNAITVLKRSIPFVEKAFNVDQAGGGADAETAASVMVRGPQAIKHRDRAVTLEDYEWLAKEASFQVARARCLPAKTKDDAGTVRLIIVPLSDELQPLPSQGLISQVKDYLDARIRRIGTANLSVFGPKYIAVSVQATVFPEKLEEADLVRRRVGENLTAFFHPLSGGPDGTGWEFGRHVYVSEVCKVIEDTEGMHHAEDVSLSSASLGLAAVDYIPVPDDALVASGEHAATVSIGAGTTSGGTTTTAEAIAAGMYMGNLHSRELHDLSRIRPQCQIERMRPEHRVFFGTVEEAKRQGYDLCGWCFGPGASMR